MQLICINMCPRRGVGDHGSVPGVCKALTRASTSSGTGRVHTLVGGDVHFVQPLVHHVVAIAPCIHLEKGRERSAAAIAHSPLLHVGSSLKVPG